MGALGIMVPPSLNWEGQPHTAPRLYFTDEFLSSPPYLWSVEIRHHDSLSYPHTGPWPKGTIVKCNYAKTPTIWVLTGRDFPLTQSHVYEGKWPD